MNIGEKYYCSKCMRELDQDGACPHCGFDPLIPPSSYCLEEGTLFQKGRYELGAVIGQGGFGITYAAWDSVLEIPVAIKEYFPANYCKRDTAETDEVEVLDKYFAIGLQTFIREARILATLQNVSSVVRVYDCFEKNNTAYIIMQFVRGETLLSYCQQKKITGKELLKLLRPLFDDLILVHQAGVLHRDISPNNILVTASGNVKLIDFGAAINIADGSSQDASLNLSFAAPEQYTMDGKQGFWTDVYGLSATIYSVMTGEIIQDAQSRAADDQVSKPLRTDKVSRRIFRGIYRGLKLNPQKRTQTMEELRADLYHLPKPIITVRQRMILRVKAILCIVMLEALTYAGYVVLDNQWANQTFETIRCYTTGDTDYALQLAEKYYEDGAFERSEHWFEWAADHGNKKAMIEYAYNLQYGEENRFPDCISQAITYYEKAAGPDYPEAWSRLGMIYLKGYASDNAEQDTERAIQYLEQGAEYEEGYALTNLGLLYEEGEVVEKDQGKAIDYLKRAAAVHDPQGLYELAMRYENGTGVEQNNTECLGLLYEAAKLNYAAAMYELGQIYDLGKFGFTDVKAAIEWYEAAGELGCAYAYYYEAHLYMNGAGDEISPEDEIKASECMADAAYMYRDWCEPAYKEVAQMAKDGYGRYKDDEFEAQETLWDFGQYLDEES